MKTSRFFAIIAAALLAVGLIGVSAPAFAAAPGGILAAGDALSSQSDSLVEKTHGCHRYPVVGPWSGILHRHVGPYCTWRKVQRRARNACHRWRNICRERCYGAPNPNRCRNRCYHNNAPNRCL